MIKYIVPFIAVITLFTACQKVVDADELLDAQEKVSITGYLSPQDTVLRVDVTRVFPAVGTPLSVNDQEANEAKFRIENALVTISDEAGNSTDLMYSEEYKTYLADVNSLAILTNQSYFLKVTVDEKEFNASCQIPKKIIEINERINVEDDNFGGKVADINLAFQDITGERNFYILGGRVKTTYQFEGYEPETDEFSLFFEDDEFLSDVLKDGGTLNGKSSNYIAGGLEVLETTITLQVANVQEILFQNLKATSTNADADGNPFVEYSIAPNNFQEDGAVGVFAGYQLTEKEVEINL